MIRFVHNYYCTCNIISRIVFMLLAGSSIVVLKRKKYKTYEFMENQEKSIIVLSNFILYLPWICHLYLLFLSNPIYSQLRLLGSDITGSLCFFWVNNISPLFNVHKRELVIAIFCSIIFWHNTIIMQHYKLQ